MAVSKPEKLDAINKNDTTKQKSSGASAIESVYFLDNFYNSVYNGQGTADTFKSLDFSDVAIYGTKNPTGGAQDENFRHFHQMRLYIDYGETLHHHSGYNGKTIITANLPEKIQYALNSKWEAPLNFGDATFNLLMQVGANKITDSNIPSGTLRVSSLKVWTATEPLTLNLSIPVIDDGDDLTGTNLVEALEILGSLCLPRYGGGAAGFYIPPPSPLSLTIKYDTIALDKQKREYDKTFTMATANSARIMLQLGGILLVDNCIIESVSVEYPNTKAQIMHDYSKIKNRPDFGMTGAKYLHPLLAIVNLKISTLEALTSDTYSRMLWAKPQSNQGKVEADITPVTKIANGLLDKIAPKDDKKNETNQPNTQQVGG